MKWYLPSNTLYWKLRYWLSHILYKDEAKRFSFSLNSPILMQNGGYIQLENKTFIHREGWQDKYVVEQMEEMAKELEE